MVHVNPSPNSLRKLLLWAGLTAVLILLVVISFSLTNKIQKQQKTDTFTAPSLEPRKAQTSEQLIPGFPEFLVYPEALLKSSNKEGQENEMKYTATWEVDNSVPQVMNWYVNHLDGFGWMIEVYPADPNASTVQFLVAKKPDLKLNLSVIREDEAATTKIVAEFLPPATEDDE